MIKETGLIRIKNRIKQSVDLILAMLSGILFLLIASSWTSPLFKGSYGYDSAFFSMMGRAILQGKVPYRDYFDIKGPVFFFLEAFGQLIVKDRMGIFVLQCMAILAVSYFICKICRLYQIGLFGQIGIYGFFYFIYFTCLWGGNSVEEYCLPFQLACTYFGLKYFKSEEEEREQHFSDYAMFYGITFGICTFSKITVAAPMMSMLIVLLIDMIMKKKWKRVCLCALWFLVGFALVCIPVFVYFIVHGALSEFLLCAFQIAFKRSTDYYECFSVKWELYLIICYAGFLISYLKRMDKGIEKWVLCSMSSVIFLSLHLGTPFDYYFITELPLLICILVFYMDDIKKLLKDASLLHRNKIIRIMVIQSALMIVLFVYCGHTYGKIKENWEIFSKETEMQYYNYCKELISIVPKEERNDIYSLESGMIIYEVNQILPTNPYPVNMPYFTSLYPPIQDEILNTIENNTPKWMISESLGDLENDEIKIAAYRHYEMIAHNSMGQLYRRID